jgi:hypothetical protein
MTRTESCLAAAGEPVVASAAHLTALPLRPETAPAMPGAFQRAARQAALAVLSRFSYGIFGKRLVSKGDQ